jgi:hypothetical protein
VRPFPSAAQTLENVRVLRTHSLMSKLFGYGAQSKLIARAATYLCAVRWSPLSYDRGSLVVIHTADTVLTKN